MRVNLVKDKLKKIAELFDNDMPTNKEAIVIVGNLLRQLAAANIKTDSKWKNINIDDANSIEQALLSDPLNLGLNLLLNSHVIIKLSDLIQDSPIDSKKEA